MNDSCPSTAKPTGSMLSSTEESGSPLSDVPLIRDRFARIPHFVSFFSTSTRDLCSTPAVPQTGFCFVAGERPFPALNLI